VVNYQLTPGFKFPVSQKKTIFFKTSGLVPEPGPGSVLVPELNLV
jgi:hypothetical protein